MSRKSSLYVDLKLVEIIALGGNQSEAARAAGCCRRTVHRRLRDPEFVAQVYAFQVALRNAAAVQAIANLNGSQKHLIQVLDLKPGTKQGFRRNMKQHAAHLAEVLKLLPHLRNL